MLAGTCKRCGWDSRGETCQTLVASVPTITHSNYYPCLDLSTEFASCLEVESCVCGGDVPTRCAAIRAKQDACLQSMDPFDADGGGDTAADWVDVQSMCHFGFSAPADYLNTPVQGTDSCVLKFSAAGCDFVADYGAFSGAGGANPGDLNYRQAAARIDGRDATVSTYTNLEPTRYLGAGSLPYGFVGLAWHEADGRCDVSVCVGSIGCTQLVHHDSLRLNQVATQVFRCDRVVQRGPDVHERHHRERPTQAVGDRRLERATLPREVAAEQIAQRTGE